MVVISGADLLGLHAEKSVTIHNCPRRVALRVMNVEENKLV